MLNLGILISGSGTNLQSIIDAINNKELNATIKVVISNNEDAYGLIRARNHNIPTVVISNKGKTREQFDTEVKNILQHHNVDFVVLAGFMRVITKVLLDAFPMKIINIHPSLLPSFPGINAQKQALDYGVKVSGCTVHFVNEGVDTGPIIEQAVVRMYKNDTEQLLKERILKEEHELLPNVLKRIANGNL
jgi:phosphoribosylglycinamide formyltransferase-1